MRDPLIFAEVTLDTGVRSRAAEELKTCACTGAWGGGRADILALLDCDGPARLASPHATQHRLRLLVYRQSRTGLNVLEIQGTPDNTAGCGVWWIPRQ
jgi:hypothetical protein